MDFLMDSMDSCNSLQNCESDNHGRVIKKIEEIFIKEEPIDCGPFEAEPLSLKSEECEDQFLVKEEIGLYDDGEYSVTPLNVNSGDINPSSSHYKQSLQGQNLSKPSSGSSIEDLSSSQENCFSTNFEEIPLQDEKPSIKLSTNSIVHVGEKPFCCTECIKEFSSNKDLQRHILVHTGEKPFVCSHCNKKFSKKATLTIHLKIHTGERPYVCSHCEKTFSQNEYLNRHLKTHTGEKPFVCCHCDKKFSRKATLNVHLKIHAGEKPYVCFHCEKTFSRNEHLNRHLKIHTGEKPYVCFHCEKTFSRSEHLNRHSRTRYCLLRQKILG